jgi:hypothetical protein
MQRFMTTSVTEAEGVSASDCTKDMLYRMQFLESLNLKAKKSMHLFRDNRGAVDLFNTWSVSQLLHLFYNHLQSSSNHQHRLQQSQCLD